MNVDWVIKFITDHSIGISLTTSIMALFWSMIAFVWNRRHTKRTFEVSTYPFVKVWLKPVAYYNDDQSFVFTRYVVGLKNQSTNVTVADTKIRMWISNPLRKWRLWERKWFSFFEGNGPDLAPSSQEREASWTPTIEDSLKVHFGSTLHVAVAHESTLKAEYSYYDLLNPYHLELLLSVEYRPAVWSSKKLTVKKLYEIRPKAHSVKWEDTTCSTIREKW